MCVSPILVNGDYVPCGTCYECQISRRSEWAFRNTIEFLNSKYAVFITLTYSDSSIVTLPFADSLGLYAPDKSHYQSFLKRLRKDFKVRYYLVHEYGSVSLRPHYHVILYFSDVVDFRLEHVYKYWHYGICSIDRLTPARIHYTTKYLNKHFRRNLGTEDYWIHMLSHDPVKLNNKLRDFFIRKNTFNRMSTKPAIGYQWLDDAQAVEFVRNAALRDGKYPSVSIMGRKFRLPRYYIRRIFTEFERDALFAESCATDFDRKFNEASRYDLSVSDLMANKKRLDDYRLDDIQRSIVSSEKF